MKKTKPQKTFSWSRKKVFSSPIHHEKNQKNEKTKKKLKYCSVDPTCLLFSNFPGKLNPKKLFPKITRWQHGCHQCSSHQATTRRKTNIDAERGIIYVLFSCPPHPKQARKNRQKAPPAFISTPLCRTPRFKCFAEPF